MALHVEREHGADAPAFIAAQAERNRLAGEQGGVDLWEAVARRFSQLSNRDVGISEGAPATLS